MGSLGIVSVYLLDLILGDPECFPHPVRMMGRLIDFLDSKLRASSSKWRERIKGVVLALVVVGISGGITYFCIVFSRRYSPFVGTLVWVYLGYATLSIKDLRVKAKAVAKELKNGVILEARKRLSQIVGRDTQTLNEEGITKAAIESIAEGTNDGIIGPLFYLIVGGPILAMAYKAISTLDSMVGYKNERYIHFGWFSAKLDDIANFIPARISGFLIAVSSIITSLRPVPPRRWTSLSTSEVEQVKESFRMMFRDGRKHPSPNSGISEAAMAGALGVRLGGPSTYQGRLLEKPYLGEDKIKIRPSLIGEALAISLVASFLMLACGVVLKWLS